jgi:hypothetical protein
MRCWRKGHPGYKGAKNLAKLCLCAQTFWKEERENHELEDLAEVLISKAFRPAARLLFIPYSERQGEQKI